LKVWICTLFCVFYIAMVITSGLATSQLETQSFKLSIHIYVSVAAFISPPPLNFFTCRKKSFSFVSGILICPPLSRALWQHFGRPSLQVLDRTFFSALKLIFVSVRNLTEWRNISWLQNMGSWPHQPYSHVHDKNLFLKRTQSACLRISVSFNSNCSL